MKPAAISRSSTTKEAAITSASEVEFFVSNDGKNFKSIGVMDNTISQETEEPVLHEFSFDKKLSARYIKMVAKKIDACPDWHVGAGEPGWIFCDEIVIE